MPSKRRSIALKAACVTPHGGNDFRVLASRKRDGNPVRLDGDGAVSKITDLVESGHRVSR